MLTLTGMSGGFGDEQTLPPEDCLQPLATALVLVHRHVAQACRHMDKGCETMKQRQRKYRLDALMWMGRRRVSPYLARMVGERCGPDGALYEEKDYGPQYLHQTVGQGNLGRRTFVRPTNPDPSWMFWRR